MKLGANFLLIRQRVVHQQSAKMMTNHFHPRLFVGISRILIDDPLRLPLRRNHQMLLFWSRRVSSLALGNLGRTGTRVGFEISVS